MKKWIKDIAALIIAILLWQYSADIIRWFDPTAGADDPGIIQAVVFACVAFLMFHFFTKLYMRMAWPTLDDYLASGRFDSEFKSRKECSQRYYLAALCYWLCMLVLALIVL